MKAAVLGAGSWGTTFAQVLCDAGTPVTLWARRADIASAITETHENPGYLPGITLPPTLTATTDVAAALDGADLVVLSVPAQTLRENLTAWAPHISDGSLVVSLMKGIELGSRKRMSEVILEVLDIPPSRVAVVSGPNLAREIAERQFAASVVACSEELSARLLQRACHTDYFRPYWATDVIGCELGGVVKNVIALAVGMGVALGLGDNTKAMLITRGLAEMARLGEAARDQHRLGVVPEAERVADADRERDDVLHHPAELASEHVGVPVGPEVVGMARPLQQLGGRFVGAGDHGRGELTLGDLPRQVRPGNHGDP